MKKHLGLSALVLVLALFVGAGAQVTGKYLGFTPDRFWDNNGILSTDHRIQSVGSNARVRVGYDSSNYADLTISSAGVLTIATTGTADSIAFSDSLAMTGATWTHKYDAASYYTITVADAGGVTFNDTSDGTASFTFSDAVILSSTLEANGAITLSNDETIDNATNGTIALTAGVVKHLYDSAAYWTATQADAGAVTFDSVSDGTAGFTFSDQINANGAVNFSGMTPAGTSGSLITTGSTWVAFPTANACGIKVLLSNTSSTGEFASMRIRGRSDSTTPTVAGNFSASAGQNDHGDLYAVQGYAQPNAYTNANATYTVGLYSCIDRTSGSSSIGYDWSTWIDTHMQVKASGSSYLLRLSHNGTVANDGAITIYNGGRMPVLFNFEDAAGFLTETGDAGSTKAGYIAVQTPAGIKYIQLVTA